MRSKRIITAIFVLVTLGVLGYISASYAGSDGFDNTSSVAEDGKQLLVSPQVAKDRVTVDRVVLTQSGYVVIRAVEGDRMGQIVEISDLLSAGGHQNITINLGDFYEGGKELIAVIYADNGDAVFNDNDKPFVGENGAITARYVATGKEVDQALLKSSATSQGHVMGGATMPQVRYTNDGFSPKSLTVAVGTMVEFVNESARPMWVASNEHPEHALLPTFDQFETVDTGGTYTYVFDKPGTWSYHDHINPSLEGVIIVE